MGPLGAAAATPGAGAPAHSEGASAARVSAPPTAAPVRPLHLSLAVSVVVLHGDTGRRRSFKMHTDWKTTSGVCTECTYLVVLPAFRGIFRVPLFLRGTHWPTHVSGVSIVIVVGVISPIPSSASHSRLQTRRVIFNYKKNKLKKNKKFQPPPSPAPVGRQLRTDPPPTDLSLLTPLGSASFIEVSFS